MIDKELAETLVNCVSSFSEKVAVKAHEYIGTHQLITGYCQYPVISQLLTSDVPEVKELREKVPYLIHNIPRYNLVDFPESKIQYSAIFNGYRTDRLNVSDIEGFDELFALIFETPELKRCFCQDDKLKKYTIERMISDIVKQYLYKIKAEKCVPENLSDLIRPFVLKKIWRFIGDVLEIDICVPICLITFSEEVISLSENIEIVRIPDEIQQSRQQACAYESDNEDWVASCATHMLVLHGYQFNNSEYFSIVEATRNYNNYPLEEIDTVMALIRIATGYTTGYEQILSFPVGWTDSVCEDLIPIYGAKGHFVNPNELTKSWVQLKIETVTKAQTDIIKYLYQNYVSLKSNKNSTKLSFSIKRLNRCMLRNERDDMAIDATIGLEALLSGGTKGEITYTISNRIPVVFALEKSDTYSASTCRSIMKTIYNYRSRVVHGDELREKDKYYKINNINVEIEKIAVDFLRHTLLFVLKNPLYLETAKFDEYIDKLVTEDATVE